MSTVVCQEPQSNYLDSQLVETRILRLKLAPPPPPCFFEFAGVPAGPTVPESPTKNLGDKSHCEEINPNPANPGLGSWSFLQNLSNSPFKTEISYVHPMATRSSSTLSHKSLELCTENLGCETGTDMPETGFFSLSPPPSDGEETPARERQKSSHRTDQPRRANDCRDFPPPLTTISGGSSCLRIRRHRENGRLIIDAVEIPPTHTYLQAERSHGRLRLSLWKDCCATTFDSEMATEENEESDVEEVENERNGEEREGGEEEEEEEEEEREGGNQEIGEESDGYGREDMEGNCSDVGVETGMEKFRRPSRCKEGGRGNGGLCNWEPFWVAT